MEPAPAQAGDPEIGRWHACPPQEGGGSRSRISVKLCLWPQ
jgi:hypothetical protein